MSKVSATIFRDKLAASTSKAKDDAWLTDGTGSYDSAVDGWLYNRTIGDTVTGPDINDLKYKGKTLNPMMKRMANHYLGFSEYMRDKYEADPRVMALPVGEAGKRRWVARLNGALLGAGAGVAASLPVAGVGAIPGAIAGWNVADATTNLGSDAGFFRGVTPWTTLGLGGAGAIGGMLAGDYLGRKQGWNQGVSQAVGAGIGGIGGGIGGYLLGKYLNQD